MLVFETKLEGNKQQYRLLDEAIRTARFIRNSCLRYWMDNQGIGRYELSAYCAVLAKEFPWADKLNSMAKQASAERAWSCGEVVKKSLSVRTHVCNHCGHTQDRDWNAARNVLEKALATVGHIGSSSLELANVSGDIDLCKGKEETPPL